MTSSPDAAPTDGQGAGGVAEQDFWTPTVRFDASQAARGRELRVLLLSTGTLATAQLPFWLNWLTANRPDYAVTVGLTASAHHFVSATAVAALTGVPVVENSWGDLERGGAYLRPVHTNLATQYDAILVYPCSIDFISALAAGSGGRPFTLALLGTRVPVALAPSFPPGVSANPIVRAGLQRLAEVPNYHLVRPHPGRSRSIDAETDVTAPMWDAVAVLERVLDGCASQPADL